MIKYIKYFIRQTIKHWIFCVVVWFLDRKMYLPSIWFMRVYNTPIPVYVPKPEGYKRWRRLRPLRKVAYEHQLAWIRFSNSITKAQKFLD